MELNDLTGKHILSGVDFITRPPDYENGRYEDATVLSFVLDGITYSAIEDPSDGYRSMMEKIVVSDEPVTNKFPDNEVLGSMREGENDILDLYDTRTGKLVLSVGTEDLGDYYPGFIASFHPENMAINSNYEI